MEGLKEGDWTDLITHREYPILRMWTAINYCDSETSSRNNQLWRFRFLFDFYRPWKWKTYLVNLVPGDSQQHYPHLLSVQEQGVHLPFSKYLHFFM